VLSLVEALQRRFVERLGAEAFARIEWLRDGGRHGGGVRFGCAETPRFNGASINVSCVHYDDEPARRLASATALSAIVHPVNPHAPSLHLHLSFTELRDGKGSWRMMADLNPSHEVAADTARFEETLRAAASEHFAAARAQGDRYFYIPALGRHRGVSHFYLEDFSSGSFEADRALAERVGAATIDLYAEVVSAEEAAHPAPDAAARARQLAYHTLYLFQVLTLDRGTTSGLMVHDQNDLGIMGSLPAWVDRALLASWEPRLPKPQDALLRAVVAALPAATPAHVTDKVRVAFAQAVRAHYRAHPEALELQAQGNVLPPTVANHGPS
jgi:coproporphyrinogen III oxidase